MKERPNLVTLSTKIFEDNKAKGFHDKEFSNEHYLSLIICELSEAIEADRKGYNKELGGLEDFTRLLKYPNDYIDEFNYYIKGTTAEELADVVIRLLDLAGYKQFKLYINEIKYSFNKEETFNESIFFITKNIFDELRNYGLLDAIDDTIKLVEALCIGYNIDLWRIVELKLEYNKLREYKHGKNY